MSIADAEHACRHTTGYRHEALFYDGTDDLLAGLVPFVRDAVDADEPVLVVLGAPKLDALRESRVRAAEQVLFADMAQVGTNPARIIPAWQRFLDDHARPGVGGGRVRGVGEPIWAGRSPAELAECERHEALLNVAFADPDFWLLCPYDIGTLPAAVLDEARRNHPFVTDGSATAHSDRFPGGEALAAPFAAALPDPPPEALTTPVTRGTLREVRRLIGHFAAAAGLDDDAVADLVLSVHELATNSVLHGGGEGSLLLWREPGAVVCEMRDRGRIVEPLAGRVEPAGILEGGRGLWMANQLCDLVQIRSFADGGAVRVHQRRY
jgi:anti-sigma regulatory factor (Ser/Thr protein kinase)